MRGEIKNRERAKQLRDFTSLCFGNITPTDIDCFIEFGDKLFVIAEAKVEGEELPFGQRLAMERWCDAIGETGRLSAALVVEHNTTPDEDIDFASCPVREYRYECKWNEPIKPVTCREAIDILLSKVHIL